MPHALTAGIDAAGCHPQTCWGVPGQAQVFARPNKFGRGTGRPHALSRPQCGTGALACRPDAPFRYYHPSLARWEKRDPFGMVDGPNSFAYVGGNPVNRVDPFGLWTFKGKSPKDWIKQILKIRAAVCAPCLAGIASIEAICFAFTSGFDDFKDCVCDDLDQNTALMDTCFPCLLVFASPKNVAGALGGFDCDDPECDE